MLIRSSNKDKNHLLYFSKKERKKSKITNIVVINQTSKQVNQITFLFLLRTCHWSGWMAESIEEELASV